MKDSPSEDIFCLFYDALDFVAEALSKGRILIHCRCGISRSTAITLAYLMHRDRCSYEQAFSTLTAQRPICSPNSGFIIALQRWEKHLAGLSSDRPRVYCIDTIDNTECTASPVYSLERRDVGCYIMHTPSMLYVWAGHGCSPRQMEEAHHLAQQLQRYEGASESVQLVHQDEEPEPFLDRLKRFAEPLTPIKEKEMKESPEFFACTI